MTHTSSMPVTFTVRRCFLLAQGSWSRMRVTFVLVGPLREPGGPPHPRTDVQRERGNQQRAYDQRVEQHAERDDERDLREEQDRQDGKRRERRRHHHTAEVIGVFARAESQVIQFMSAIVMPQKLLPGLTCCRCPTPSTPPTT